MCNVDDLPVQGVKTRKTKGVVTVQVIIYINALIVLSDENHNIDDMTAISAAKVCQQRAGKYFVKISWR